MLSYFSATEKPLIVITGITGYIGSQILNYCIEHLGKDYRLRGTVRDPDNEEKMAPLYDYFGGEEILKGKMEICHVDLLDEATISAAIEGASYVIHTASPVGIEEPVDENEMIKPAVDGTLSVMRAASTHGVKRVVITSSVAAIETQSPTTTIDILDETFWSDFSETERVSSYSKSKTLAEKAAWDFVESVPEGQHKPELVTILPGLVLGEYICGGAASSPALIKSIIMNTMPGIPRLAFSAVDMKDVVQAHVNGLFREEAANQRFIVVKENLWIVEICRMIRDAVPAEYKEDIQTDEMSKCPIYLVALFNSDAKFALDRWGFSVDYTNEKSRNLLGLDYATPIAESVGKTANTLIERGAVSFLC